MPSHASISKQREGARRIRASAPISAAGSTAAQDNQRTSAVYASECWSVAVMCIVSLPRLWGAEALAGAGGVSAVKEYSHRSYAIMAAVNWRCINREHLHREATDTHKQQLLF